MVKNNFRGMAVLLIFVLFIASCTGTATTDASRDQNDRRDLRNFPKEAQIKEAQIIDGVQVAYLAWGKLNYEPSVIKLKSGMPAKIIADTERLQGCFRSFVVPELEIFKSFNENDKVLEFTPAKTGTFSFGCPMGMGSGTLVVE